MFTYFEDNAGVIVNPKGEMKGVLLDRSVHICGLGLQVQPMLLFSVLLEFKSYSRQVAHHFLYPIVMVLISYLFDCDI